VHACVCVCVCVCLWRRSIEKNPQLCYTETVSWRHILPDGFNYRRIQQNKPNYECVDVCPVRSNCPTGEVTGSAPQTSSHTRPLCWNEKHCQKGKLAARLAILLSVCQCIQGYHACQSTAYFSLCKSVDVRFPLFYN